MAGGVSDHTAAYRAKAVDVDLDTHELLSLIVSQWEWIALVGPIPQYIVDRFGVVNR